MGLQLNIGSLTSGSGIDVQSTVDQLMSLQKAPLTHMQQQQNPGSGLVPLRRPVVVATKVAKVGKKKQ